MNAPFDGHFGEKEMPQLTVRDVDEALHQTLKREAERRGQSVNRYILHLLHQALNLDHPQIGVREYSDLDHLAGTWTKKEAEEFDAQVQSQRQIDRDLWS